jgi:hypothetical protein
MKTINNIDDLSESAINKLYSFKNWADKMSEKCPEDGKGTHGVPNGYISCEGRCCQEAYEMYIEEWTE